MTEDLLETKEGRVAILTMNRPDRLNAMSGGMLDALIESLNRLADDNDIGLYISVVCADISAARRIKI